MPAFLGPFFEGVVAGDEGFVLGGDVSISSPDDCSEFKSLSDDSNDNNDGLEFESLFGPASDCGVSSSPSDGGLEFKLLSGSRPPVVVYQYPRPTVAGCCLDHPFFLVGGMGAMGAPTVGGCASPASGPPGGGGWCR